MSDLNYLDIDKICRACLFQSDDMNYLDGIVESIQMSLGDVLMACSKITQRDELPNLMCSGCTDHLLNAYNFKLKCEQSDKVLTDYLTKPMILDENRPEPDDLSQDPINIKIEVEEKVKVDSDHSIAEDEYHNSVDATVLISFADEIVSDKKNKFHCDICQNAYNHKKSLIRHLNKAHNANISNRCKVCSKVFAKGSQLENHVKKHTKNAVFNCATCGEDFETKLALKAHQTKHSTRQQKEKLNILTEIKLEMHDVDNSLCMPHGTKTVQCKICNEKFQKIYKLRYHLNNHKGQESFQNLDLDETVMKALSPNVSMNRDEFINDVIKCINDGNTSQFYSIITKCGNELSISDSETENDDDDENSKDKSQSKSYECEICYKTFNRRYKILYHQKNDHDNAELIHQCTKCLWKFASYQLLANHLKSQCDNECKKYSCDECNMKFMWYENLDVHITSRHSVEAIRKKRKEMSKEKRYICETCDKKFMRCEHLERHKTIHLPNDKKYECTICQKKFNRKDNMRSHMRIHDANRDKDDGDKHLCVYCGRSFTNSSNLIVHMRRHTGEKPYKCDICNKGFPRSSDLQCHRRTHTGEKPCLCTICGKGFSRSNKLVRHMRIHTGVRPYKCTYCDRAFTQSNDLTLHVRRHTGDKPYVCGVCGDRFIQGTALQTHRRLKGHYEGPQHNAPFSSISVNNPNRLNFANRVDRIGLPKVEPAEPIEIKPVGRASNFRASYTSREEDESMVLAATDTADANVLSGTTQYIPIEEENYFSITHLPYAQ